MGCDVLADGEDREVTDMVFGSDPELPICRSTEASNRRSAPQIESTDSPSLSIPCSLPPSTLGSQPCADWDNSLLV
jgi:hypothetical protein